MVDNILIAFAQTVGRLAADIHLVPSPCRRRRGSYGFSLIQNSLGWDGYVLFLDPVRSVLKRM